MYTSIAITPSLDSLRKYMDKYIEFAQVLIQKYENDAFELRFSEGVTQWSMYIKCRKH